MLSHPSHRRHSGKTHFPPTGNGVGEMGTARTPGYTSLPSRTAATAFFAL
jgi:hypothetical protein